MSSRQWGVASAYGDLKSVLMHRPGPELDVVTNATLREFNYDAPVDTGAFLADYDAMVHRFFFSLKLHGSMFHLFPKKVLHQPPKGVHEQSL